MNKNQHNKTETIKRNDSNILQLIKPTKKRKPGDLPWRFTDPKNFCGYEKTQVHPRFWTTSSVYGSRGPTETSLPEKYFGSNNQFSKSRMLGGNYRNCSLNI